MSEEENVRGVVAQIVSDREVILNRGSSDGLNAGDYVVVIDPNTQSVVDPESGEDLGGVKRIKAVLKVSEVTDKLALAATFRTHRVRVGGGLGMGETASSLSSMLAAPKYETRVETIKIGPMAGRPISQEESVISVSDPFETITAEEAEDARSVTLWR